MLLEGDNMRKIGYLNKNINLIDKIIFNISILTLSFLSSRIMIIGNFPLGISIVSSVKNLIPSMIGSFFGYFSIKNVSISVRYISTMIAVFLMRSLFGDLKKLNNYILYAVIVNFIPNFATGMSSRIAYGLTFRSFTECVLESFISMGFSCFLRFVFSFLNEKKEKFNGLVFPFTIFIILSPFINTKIFSISIINIINISVLLYFSYYMQVIGGSICGILQGIIYMILKPESYIESISFPIAGMFSGACSSFGKFFVSLTYVVSYLIIRMQFNSYINHSDIIEILFGIILFMYISEKIEFKYSAILEFFNFSEGTYSLAHQNISIAKSSLVNSKKIFNDVSFKSNKNFKSDSKNLVNSYLDSINQICDNLSNSIDIEVNENLSLKIKKYIKKVFKSDVKVSCAENYSKKIIIQLEFYKFDLPKDLEKLSEELCFICGKSFMKMELFFGDSSTIIRTCERTNLNPLLLCKQHTTKGEKYCGDSFKSFFDGLGKFYIVMCDGMGTGNSAAISGNMTSEVIKNMIRSGIDFKTSISIANSLLMSKSSDESLSTVDIFSLDLYSGDATFVKAGGASSFVRKGRDVAKISSETFPIGILSEFNLSKTNCKLQKEDIVLIVSDGITDTGEEWIENTLRNEINIMKLNDRIVNQALKFREEGNDDDITSITIKI